MRVAQPWLVIALVLMVTGRASAGKWPQPAMGASRSGDPEVVFTFDDGPHPTITPKLIDMLDVHGIDAVFFWVGWRIERLGEKVTPIVVETVAGGHIVANHTFHHAHLCQSPRQVGGDEIDRTANLLHQVSAMPIVWFRTPYGARCHRVESLLGERGLDHFHWDIDPQEWRGLSSATTISHVTSRLRDLADGQRAVILLHDTKRSTLQALPKILDWISRENKLRSADGRRPIRIVPAYQLAVEQLNPELAAWAMRLAEGGRGAMLATVAVMP